MDGKNSKTERRAKHVPETAQMRLIGEAAEPLPEKRIPAHDEDFINPSPENIFIGNQKLGDYLKERRWSFLCTAWRIT